MEEYIEVQKNVMLSISFCNKGFSKSLIDLFIKEQVELIEINKILKKICKSNNLESHNLANYNQLMDLDVSILFRFLIEDCFVLNLLKRRNKIDCRIYSKKVEEFRKIRNNFAHPKAYFCNGEYIKPNYLYKWISGPITYMYSLFDYKIEEVESWNNSLLYFLARPEEIIPRNIDDSIYYYTGSLMY